MMNLTDDLGLCSKCNNHIVYCSCACAYCGKLDSCNCVFNESAKINVQSKPKRKFVYRLINSLDNESKFIGKWQIGRRRFS